MTPTVNEFNNFVNHAGYEDGMSYVSTFLSIYGTGVINQVNSTGETAFIRAADHQLTDMMDYLASQGAETLVQPNGASNIHWLAGRGNRVAVNWLLAKGVPVDGRADGVTPLLRASHIACPELIADLIAAGADVNARDGDDVMLNKGGNTPLMLSSFMTGAGPNIPVLLEKGANLNAINSSGNTALDLAILFRREAELRLLLAAGADMYQKNAEGRCPLDYAREQGFGPLFDAERQRRGEAIASHIACGIDRALPVRTFRLKSKSAPKFQPAF